MDDNVIVYAKIVNII